MEKLNGSAVVFGAVLGMTLGARAGGTPEAIGGLGVIGAALSGVAWVWSPVTSHNDGIVHSKPGGGEP